MEHDMTNYFQQEYQLDPLVEDLYAVLEKHCGNPTQPWKLASKATDAEEAMLAALIIWAALAKRGVQISTSEKLGITRTTLTRRIRDNKYLSPVAEPLFDRDPMRDMLALKCKMGLNRNG
jgi:DNA-binding NtrC family response regulator